jgi:predicted porin
MMKKIVVALAMVPVLARADLATGTFELSGNTNLGFTSGSQKDKTDAGSTTTDSTAYGLSTAGLYYVIPNLGVGLRLAFGSSTTKSNGVKTEGTSFLVGPAISYEVPVAPQLAVFGLGAFGYVSDETKISGSGTSLDGSVTSTGYGANVDVGVKYFLVKNFSFNAAIGYEYFSVEDNRTPKGTTTRSDFGLNLGLSVYFGGGAGH